jgi:hypothetical protein
METLISSGNTATSLTTINLIIPDGCSVKDLFVLQDDNRRLTGETAIEESSEPSNNLIISDIGKRCNTTDVSSIKIEFFARVNNRDNHSSKDLDKLINWATSDATLKRNTHAYKKFLLDNPNATKKQISDEKMKRFPAITFSGTFDGTGKADDISKMSGLIVLDFDHVKNLDSVHQTLQNDMLTYLMFISPSGDGLKVIVKHDMRDHVKWQWLYRELEEYYFNKFQMGTDKSGKDISRMCYIPFIENLYKNENSRVWNYTGKFERQQELLEKIDKQSDVVKYTNTEITDELYTECFYMSVFLAEHKINLTEEYSEWISYGFSLCTFGENGREIFQNISCVSTKYDRDECDKQYDKMLRDFKDDRSGIDKYLIKAKEAIAKLVNQKIKDEIILPPDTMYGELPLMLKIPLMKYHDTPKFMALLAGITNVSAILPNLKFIHHGTYKYEANLFTWIIAKQSSGKNVVNEMQKICGTIEDNIEKEFASNYREYKEREAHANAEDLPFNESKPVQKTLFLGADITKAGFVKKLQENDGRGIISTTEAQTLIGSNYTTYGAFLDLILACYGHERYQKTLKDYTFKIPETYLSLILASTPETCYKFFANSNIENGLLSRFLAFEINSDNGLKNIDDNALEESMTDIFETNKINFYQLWKNCMELGKPVFLNITKEIKDNIFEQYKAFENDIKYVYKFNPEVVKRMLIMHKRLILIFSALFHYEKYYTFDLDVLNDRLSGDWKYNNKLPADQRAIEISEAIMKSYRDAFIRLMFGIEQQKYRKLSISARNDKILQMKLQGHSPDYLSMLFDLPRLMIDVQTIDKRFKVNDEQKNACLEFCRRNPREKETAAKIAGVDIRTVQRWCKAANIGDGNATTT